MLNKNATLTPNSCDFYDLRNYVAKFCCQNVRTFSADFFGLKNWIQQTLSFFGCMKNICLHQVGIHAINILIYPFLWIIFWIVLYRLGLDRSSFFVRNGSVSSSFRLQTSNREIPWLPVFFIFLFFEQLFHQEEGDLHDLIWTQCALGIKPTKAG